MVFVGDSVDCVDDMLCLVKRYASAIRCVGCAQCVVVVVPGVPAASSVKPWDVLFEGESSSTLEVRAR